MVCKYKLLCRNLFFTFFLPHIFYTNTIFGNTTFIYPTFFTDIYIIFTPTFFVPTFKSSLLLFFYDPHCFSFFFTSLEPLRHGPVHAAKKSQKVKIINYFLMVIFNVFLGKKTRRKAVHLCSKRSTAAQAVHRGGPVHAAFFSGFSLNYFLIHYTTLT